MTHSAYYGNVARLGEVIRFGDTALKASLKNSTSATYSLANRAFYIEGQAFRGDFTVGDYFSRDCEDGFPYMVVTLNAEPLAPDLVYLYACRCNAEITVMRYKGRGTDEKGNIKDIFEPAYTDIPVFRDFTTRSGKQTGDGIIDRAIYTMILPHRYALSEKDRVIMKVNSGGGYADKAFYVENVGSAIAYAGGAGVDTAQLSLDTRS